MKKDKTVTLMIIGALLLCSCGNTSNRTNIQPVGVEASSYSVTDDSTVPNESEVVNPIDDFVEEFNAASDTDLIYVEDFTPSDRSSSHYRHEFRLNAYSEAIAKSYTFDGATVDLVYRETIFEDEIIRVYVSGATYEQCEQILRLASPIMDSTVTDEDIDDTIDYINGHSVSGRREANGYYYSELCIVYSETSEECTLMIKLRND